MTAGKPSFLELGARLSDRRAFARFGGSCLFSSRQLHQFIEIKRAAAFRSHLSKVNLIPTIHPIRSIAFLPDAHRFTRDNLMDDFLVSGA